MHRLRTIQRYGEVAAPAMGEVVHVAHQEKAVGGHGGLQPALPRDGERLADRAPSQGLGEGKSQVRARTECGDLVGDMPEQIDWHRPGLGPDQVGAEVGLVVAGADVAHDATQVAEVVHAQEDLRRPEGEMAGQHPLVQGAQACRHGRTHGEVPLTAGPILRRGAFRCALDISV